MPGGIHSAERASPAVTPRTRFLLRRLVWTVVVLWLVLSVTFVIFAYTPDPNEQLVAFGAGFGAVVEGENATAAQLEALETYRDARSYDEPLLERYTNWMVGYATLEWGFSFGRGKPVIDVVRDRGAVTLAYLLPAIGLAVVGGTVAGLVTAAAHGRPLDRLGSLASYLGLGLPVFVIAEVGFAIAVSRFGWVGIVFDDRFGAFHPVNLDVYVLPAVAIALNVYAVQVRYTRAESLSHYTADFVRTLRSVGAGRGRIARRVLRNAAVPLVSLFFTETLTVLFVSVYVVEVALGVPGLGQAAFVAIEDRDVGLILATTLLPVFVGVFGNLLQDVAYGLLDPRIGTGDERE